MSHAQVSVITDDLVHQSIRQERIACGKDINKVVSTSSCAHVTCPECRAFVERLVDAVFVPLNVPVSR